MQSAKFNGRAIMDVQSSSALLRDAVKREPSEKIRQELLRKLGEGQAEPQSAEQSLPVDPGADKLLPGGEELMVQ